MSDLSALESKFRRLAELREIRDIDKRAAEASEAEYREFESQVLADVDESALKGSIEFDFGEDLGTIRFQPRRTIYGQVVDKNAALDAFENAAIVDEMTSPKIEARRLNEYVRDLMEAGQELPDGIGHYERRYITISRKK